MSSPSAPPREKSIEAEGRGGPHGGDNSLRAIDLTADGPPAEVLDQMARADEINMRLRRSGREICFALSSDGCSLQIELREGGGGVIRLLSLSEAADIAEGGSLPE
jgi:hypothetical protein